MICILVIVAYHLLFLVRVEATAGFLAEPACVDVFHEQGGWTVLVVAQLGVQNPHDCETRVQPDEISEGEWTHWHVCPEFHCRVDILLAGNALLN